jgi:RNA polymerase sigma factor (sigma-70 family)
LSPHALRLPWSAPRPALPDLVRPEAGDEALARRAAAGDGAAFATLYDRYERRVYNFSYRLTGSAEDAADATQETFVAVLERLPRLEGRELNFGAYVMTAARNASYDAIARRKRATPAGDIPDSAVPVLAGGDDPDRPEQEALREAHQEQIRLANETLPPRQREALALRELDELSYDEVAEIMGMNRNSVAQLISRARINLRDGLRQTALGSVAAASELCERALPLLAMRQDGVLDDDASAGWLAEHLVGCGTCRVRVDAMEEAGVAYRLWLPLVPALWLKTEAVARAAERVGADWSAHSGTPRGRGRHLRLVAAAGSLLVIALVLALVDRAQTPMRAPAVPTPEATVVAAPVEVAPKATGPIPGPATRRVRRAPERRAKPKADAPPLPAPEPPPVPTPIATGDAAPAATGPVERVRQRPRRVERKAPRANEVAAAEPVVADPLPEPVVEQPVEEPDPPAPLCPGPNCPGDGSVTTPTCPAGSACPPPPRRPPVVACTRCGGLTIAPPRP